MCVQSTCRKTGLIWASSGLAKEFNLTHLDLCLRRHSAIVDLLEHPVVHGHFFGDLSGRAAETICA